MISRGRPCLVGRAWRLATLDTAEVSVHHDPAMRGPEAADPYPGISQWPGGYIESLDVSALPEHAPGQGQGWLTNPYPLIEGETTDPMVKLIGMVDTANGVAPARMPDQGVTPSPTSICRSICIASLRASIWVCRPPRTWVQTEWG